MLGCRDACAPAEVSFPAGALRDALVARWVREHKWAVDVRTVAELHSAISVGIHPVRMTVHADQLGSGGIRRASAAGVGGLVLSRREQVATLRANHTHHVLLRMSDATMRVSHNAAEAVIGCRSTVLVGLLCEVGAPGGCSAAVGDTLAEMDHIRRRHNVVLTRLVVGLGEALPAAGSSVVRRDLAEEIGESVDDACAALRFPRPVVVMAA
ncbi:LysA protein [Mycolicibacterium aichiense]|uniref:LysA protein n=2 Tax=Mycolicibacterium aichiense TaxID=1799 RepID=A0AAD1MB34_9MYCO|nr:LysA protein [Mycolicibacterium aichiense]STZ24401.1 diaminopimelate decarboxylase [Mycolicibacterium aichiense]